MESHDALLFCIQKSQVEKQAGIIKEEMERPIDFSRCSLRRRPLIIPCDVEIGENYQHFSKFKFPKVDKPVYLSKEMPKKTVQEEFMAEPIGQDTKLDRIIYESQERKNL